MIKLFKNIRQKLLKEGKTISYLKYALGEIILVVIGILIALQVNNWNENRNENIRAHKVLQNLSDELKEDSTYFANVYNSEKSIFLASAERLFDEHITEQLSKDNDTILARAFRFACFTPAIKSSRNAYTELMSSDLINQIHSEDLRRNLKQYYGQIDFLQQYSEQTYALSNTLIEALSNYYEIIPLNPNRHSNQFSNFSGAGEDLFTARYDLKAFRNDKSLNPKLYDMIDIHKDRLGGLENLKALSINIQKEIREELKHK
ncbi:DUF6090 family protein [Gaetbulibacter aestuarii]|uniref:DUF6090 family protein n=1 Tax=Gaetbulibacter aestuarii TaxID=1502358 RepID=A0ABW7MV67_9FLAO